MAVANTPGLLDGITVPPTWVVSAAASRRLLTPITVLVDPGFGRADLGDHQPLHVGDLLLEQVGGPVELATLPVAVLSAQTSPLRPS
jgi:hypothetical protein